MQAAADECRAADPSGTHVYELDVIEREPSLRFLLSQEAKSSAMAKEQVSLTLAVLSLSSTPISTWCTTWPHECSQCHKRPPDETELVLYAELASH